jgi:hypothetical protein
MDEVEKQRIVQYLDSLPARMFLAFPQLEKLAIQLNYTRSMK